MIFSLKHPYSPLQQYSLADNGTERVLPNLQNARLQRVALRGSEVIITVIIGFSLGLLVNIRDLKISMQTLLGVSMLSPPLTNRNYKAHKLTAAELPDMKITPTRFNGSFEFSGLYRG